MFHTASYFPLKQAGDFSLWNYIKCVRGERAHVSVTLGVFVCMCLFLFFYMYSMYKYVSMTVYLKDRLFCWWKIKRLRLFLFFSIMHQIVSGILLPCNVTLTHWHVKWELRERKPKRERWEMERRDKRERERLKIHLRNLPRDTTSDIGNFCRKITSS